MKLKQTVLSQLRATLTVVTNKKLSKAEPKVKVTFCPPLLLNAIKSFNLNAGARSQPGGRVRNCNDDFSCGLTIQLMEYSVLRRNNFITELL